MSPTRVGLQILVLLLALEVARPASMRQGREAAPEIRYVAAGMENARSLLSPASARVTLSQFTPRQVRMLVGRIAEENSQETVDRESTQTARWYCQGDRLSMSVEPAGGPDTEPLRLVRLVADERDARILYRYARPDPETEGEWHLADSGSILPVGGALAHGLWQTWERLDPRYWAYFDGEQPLDRELLASEPPPAFVGEEQLYDSRCMKIELWAGDAVRVFYWIDVDHSFIIRRSELYQKVGDEMRLVREVDTSEVAESGGCWLPARVESRFSWQVKATGQAEDAGRLVAPDNTDPTGIKVEEGIATLPPVIQRVTITDFAANQPIPAEVFSLEWPLDTEVHDQITNRYFVVTALSPAEYEKWSVARDAGEGGAAAEED